MLGRPSRAHGGGARRRAARDRVVVRSGISGQAHGERRAIRPELVHRSGAIVSARRAPSSHQPVERALRRRAGERSRAVHTRSCARRVVRLGARARHDRPRHRARADRAGRRGLIRVDRAAAPSELSTRDPFAPRGSAASDRLDMPARLAPLTAEEPVARPATPRNRSQRPPAPPKNSACRLPQSTCGAPCSAGPPISRSRTICA